MTKWGPTGEEVYKRTYSRLKADGSNESWPETVVRVVDGNLALCPDGVQPGERERLIELMEDFKVLPAGRHLWTSGVPGRQFNRNCHRSGWGPGLSDHFTFMFDELMKGGGVGANYSRRYLKPLPAVLGHVDVIFGNADDAAGDLDLLYFAVPDSREGWVDALRFIFEWAEIEGKHTILFDLDEVRPAGSPIRGFGGTASGPEPLANALTTVATVLRSVARAGGRLGPVSAMEIDHAIAGCVVAGNVRRSARMSMLHWHDPEIFEFISLKTSTGSHWTTNLSVEIDDEFLSALADRSSQHYSFANAVFQAALNGMLENGEPGFYNSSLASIGENGDVGSTNPCGEIALEEWESCNLGHVNLSAYANDLAGALEAFSLMARFLVRATFAELLDPRQAEVEARNRRIGVGVFGFQEWAALQGIKYSESHQSTRIKLQLKTFKDAVRWSADRLADHLGIPRPIKVTTVAPTGTIAKMPGVTEGIHAIYARYFERRVRYADTAGWEALASDHAIEDCIYNPNTKVVVFNVKDTLLDLVDESLVEQADEIAVEDMLGVQAMFQEFYADNAVSYTANVPPTQNREELAAALKRFLPVLKGTTIMVDGSRPQSPYTRITREQYEASLTQEIGQGFDECKSGACPIR